MPIGGKLVLKGNLSVTSHGVSEKTKKKKKRVKDEASAAAAAAAEAAGAEEEGGAAKAPKIELKSYEEEFSLEMEKASKAKAKATPWGSGYRPAPEILHGYSTKVKGKTAEERLDMRSAMKSDKFCK